MVEVGGTLTVSQLPATAQAGQLFTAKATVKSTFSSAVSYKVVFSFNGMTKEVTGIIGANGSVNVQATLGAPCKAGSYPYQVSVYYYAGNGKWVLAESKAGSVQVSGSCPEQPKPKVPSIFDYLGVTISPNPAGPGSTVKFSIVPKSGLYNYLLSAYGQGARYVKFTITPDWGGVYTTPAYYAGQGFQETVNLVAPKTPGQHAIKVNAQVQVSGTWVDAGTAAYALQVGTSGGSPGSGGSVEPKVIVGHSQGSVVGPLVLLGSLALAAMFMKGTGR